jgi:hypothetical protein
MRKENYLQLVTSFVGLIITLIAFAGAILNLTNQPQQLRIFSLIGYAVFFGGILWLAFRERDISQGWQWAGLGLLYLITIPFFIWVGTWNEFPNNSSKEANALDIPLQVAQIYDFETEDDPTVTTPWISVPPTKTHTILISDEEAFARSGTHSLRLKVDIQPYYIDETTEYAGVGFTEAGLSNVKAAVAWVLIPKSEPIQNVTLRSHIIVWMYDENDEGIGFFGEAKEIEPGEWTSLFIGTFAGTSTLDDFIWNGKIDELYVTVWSDKPYTGSIYVDDFTIYK